MSLSPIFTKLGDFGFSKRVPNNNTALRTVGGQHEYMAPEVDNCSPSYEYTNAVDIWSLGCVVHRILTGQTPFANARERQRYSYKLDEFPTQHLIKQGISKAGVEFVRGLMKVDPSTRPFAIDARRDAWLNTVNEDLYDETRERVLDLEGSCH